MSKSQRSFVFTLFDESKDDIIISNFEHIKYMIYQLEQCPITFRLHYQGYIELKEKRTFNFMKTLFSNNSVHIEFCKGNADQARSYSCKNKTRLRGPWEYGIYHGKLSLKAETERER